MTETEQQLSRLFNAVIGEPPRQVSVHAVRRRAVRRRRLTYAAATAAIAVAGSVGVALASPTASPHGPASGHPMATRIPAYYFEQIPGDGHNIAAANTIRSTATGTVAGTVTCPAPSPDPVSLVAAGGTSSGQVFFLACPTASKAQPRRLAGTRIYQFTVSRSGHVSGLKPTAGGNLVDQVPQSLGASPDGSELALSEFLPGGSLAFRILVINTRTGKRAVWTATPRGGRLLLPGSLSFAGQGRELAVFGSFACIRQSCHAGYEMVAVSPAWRGGTLASGRVLFSGTPGPTAAILSPDGKTAVLCVLRTDNRDGPRIVSISAGTGKLIRVLLTIGKGDLDFVSVDPSGRHVLVVVGSSSNAFQGWIDNGKLIPVPGPRRLPLLEAW
jgi:hypothetical protein